MREPLFTIRGIVNLGHQRGKGLGFPTANIDLNEPIPEGIYAAEVIVDGKFYQAASFVGSAETFGDTDYKLESYIFDFDQDIYGHEITVKLYQKIRKSQKFSTVEQLVEQIHQDVAVIKRYFLQE